VLKLARVADAGVELLMWVVLTSLAAVGFEQVPAVLGEDGRAFVFTDGNEPDQALVLKVYQGVVMRSRIPVVDGFEISLGYHSKCPDGRQRETVLAVQLVEVFSVVPHQFALHATRQLQALHKRIARVVAPRVGVTLEVLVAGVCVARIVKPARVVDVEVVVVA
jgi:hypothetical protein